MALHNRFDQFAKNILRDALARASTTGTEEEVLAATQKIDVYCVPDPAREAERDQMGLLGELSAAPTLFEPFHNTPSLGEVRRCVCKQHTWHGELTRRARVECGRAVASEDIGPAPDALAVLFPWLVILSPGRPLTVLDAYGCERVGAGVYHTLWGLALRVIVLSELPRTRATLLLRLLGSGRVLSEALSELSEMPEVAWERRVAMPLVVLFRLWIEEPATQQEENVSAEIQAWFEDYQQKLRAEGRNEGRNEGRARALLTVLRVRGVAVPDAARERILAQKDPEQLDRWLEKAALASSIAEVLDDPS